MSNEVDELFAEGDRGVQPRSALVTLLVAIGLGIALLGFPCSAVPGGLVVLVGWFVAEKENARLESGFFPSDLGRRVRTARSIAIYGVLATAAIFSVQLLLTMNGTYEQWWSGLVVTVGELIWGPLPDA